MCGNSSATMKSWQRCSWSTKVRSVASVTVSAEKHEPNFRRMSFTRITPPFTRKFTAHAKVRRRSSCVG
jgi:hypothetical protein